MIVERQRQSSSMLSMSVWLVTHTGHPGPEMSFTEAGSACLIPERMIAMVTRAEERLARGRKVMPAAHLPAPVAPLAEVAPIVRGAVALKDPAADGAWVAASRIFTGCVGAIRFPTNAIEQKAFYRLKRVL